MNAAKSCKYRRVKEKPEHCEKFPWTPLDIEDLAKIGKKEGLCPYYANRIRSEKADLILMPYNYIFDSRIRRRLELDMTGDILIVDEAHNLP